MFMAAIAVATVQQSNAQQGSFLDKVSLEVAYGYNMALTPDNVETADVSGFNTVQLGANYQINNLWGVRGTYSNTTFKHKNFDNASINYNKLTAEATFNVLNAINNAKFPTTSTAQKAGSGKQWKKTSTMRSIFTVIVPKALILNSL